MLMDQKQINMWALWLFSKIVPTMKRLAGRATIFTAEIYTVRAAFTEVVDTSGEN